MKRAINRAMQGEDLRDLHQSLVSAFLAGLYAGMASPLLFTLKPPKLRHQDFGASTEQAWRNVGGHMRRVVHTKAPAHERAA
uniref:Uncharacterized protein n=1 Tax=Rhodoplanes serenus TaxID=200615 RepID=A0AAJ5T9P4_9BRAD|nr:hypothetical protein RHODPL_RHODPL_00030 [Rhodoplanes serenus]